MRIHKKLCLLSAIIISMCCNGCSDPNAVLDKTTEIDNHNWSYANVVKYDVAIDNPDALYNLCLNLRVTGDYKYANLFILFHENGPGLKPKTIRFEFKLASQDGEWFGTGSGNLYSYQTPFITNFKFPAKGTYHFVIEQNMRDNPLHEVSDVGLRVEKVK